MSGDTFPIDGPLKEPLVSEDIIIVPCFLAFFAWVAWLLFSTIRRYKISKLQAELQHRLLEKVSSGQELLAYAQSPAGKQLIEALRVETAAPHTRIIGALQTAIVMLSLGVALLFLHNRVIGAEEGFLIFGTIITVLGIGFGISSAAAYYLSKSFGLLNDSHA